MYTKVRNDHLYLQNIISFAKLNPSESELFVSEPYTKLIQILSNLYKKQNVNSFYQILSVNIDKIDTDLI